MKITFKEVIGRTHPISIDPECSTKKLIEWGCSLAQLPAAIVSAVIVRNRAPIESSESTTIVEVGLLDGDIILLRPLFGGPPPGPFPHQWIESISAAGIPLYNDESSGPYPKACSKDMLAKDVPLKPQIVMKFCTKETTRDPSEASEYCETVNVKVITEDHIFLSEKGERFRYPVDVRSDPDTRSVIITPRMKLDPGTEYNVQLNLIANSGVEGFLRTPDCPKHSTLCFDLVGLRPDVPPQSGFRNPGNWGFCTMSRESSEKAYTKENEPCGGAGGGGKGPGV